MTVKVWSMQRAREWLHELPVDAICLNLSAVSSDCLPASEADPCLPP